MAYVYHIVVDDIVRYVGKGNGNRIKDHLSQVRAMVRRKLSTARQSKQFYKKLRNAWLNGSKIDEIIIIDGLSEEAAFDKEAKEITKHKQTLWGGTLINVGSRLGRPGSSGYKWTKETRQILIEALKSAWTRPEVREKHIKDRIEKWRDPNYRRKQKVWRKKNNDERFAESIQKKVLNLLLSKPGLKPREIAAILKLKESQKGNILGKLRRKGLVKRRGCNHYDWKYYVSRSGLKQIK